MMSAQTANARRPCTPTSACTLEGSPKIPAPMIPLIMSATVSHRRTSRMRPGARAGEAEINRIVLKCLPAAAQFPAVEAHHDRILVGLTTHRVRALLGSNLDLDGMFAALRAI